MPEDSKMNSPDFEAIYARLREFPVQFGLKFISNVGQEEVLDQLMIALLCNGHVLLTEYQGWLNSADQDPSKPFSIELQSNSMHP